MSKKEPERKSSRTLSNKVASMAAAVSTGDIATLLAAEMEKQREHLKMDMTALIKTSLAPIQASIANFQEMVDDLDKRVTAVESTAGENFDSLFRAEQDITNLKKLNATLTDRIDDLENRARRVNVRIINVPEGSEKKADNMVTFVSTLLKDYMGDTFPTLPKLERAHRVNPRKLKKKGNKATPRPIIAAFHNYEDRERVLSWARRNEMIFEEHTVRFYPDLSAHLSRKRAAFKNIKAALYRKGIKFNLLYPARLRVHYGEDEPHIFDTPDEAEEFLTQKLRDSPDIPVVENRGASAELGEQE